MEKSHVTMEQRQCIACGKLYDTGAILLDKRLAKVFERHTTTGHGLCDEHTKEGFITLIEVEPPTGHVIELEPSEAVRTGAVALVRRSVWPEISSVPAPVGEVMFVERGVIARLAQLASDAE